MLNLYQIISGLINNYIHLIFYGLDVYCGLIKKVLNMKNSVILFLVGTTLASVAKEDDKGLSQVAGCFVIAGVLGIKFNIIKKVLTK